MSETGEGPRRYSEEEIERILARAAELEAEKPPAADAGGMTLAELEQIGAEAGLHPELLRTAARELDRGVSASPVGSRRLLGAPVVVRFEREVEGELGREGLERLIPELRRTDGTGHAAVVGETLSWQSTDQEQTRTLAVTVSSSGGRTRIWVEEHLGRLAGSLFGGIVGGVGGGVGFGVGLGVGLGALGSAAFAVAFPVVVVSGSYALARTLFQARYRDRSETLSRLMDRLLREVERSRSVGDGHRGDADRGIPPESTPGPE